MLRKVKTNLMERKHEFASSVEEKTKELRKIARSCCLTVRATTWVTKMAQFLTRRQVGAPM